MASNTILKANPETLAAASCALLLGAAALAIHNHLALVGIILLVLAYLTGGYASAIEGLTTLWQEQELDVDLLMIVAALGAAALGWWQRDFDLAIDGAVLILIFAISGVLESYAMDRTERSIQSLMSLTPDSARLIDGETMVSIGGLKIGDRLLVKPGELIPTDAKIISGSSSINQAAITGESLPVEKTIGAEVFGGTINGSGVLELEVHQPPASSLIQRIIQLVKQAQTENTPTQDSIEQFERLYAKIIVISGLAIGIVPALIGWWDWETAIYRALIFLVVASPCALMAAIMPGLLSGIANGARQGILFKNGSTLEAIGQVKTIAFDKTGTLTTGQLQVAAVWYLAEDGIVQQESSKLSTNALRVMTLAASIEFGSEHLIGKAIQEFAAEQGLVVQSATQISAEPGKGISGFLDQQTIFVGKAEPTDQWVQLVAGGQTIAWVLVDGVIQGAITCRDYLRPEAVETIKSLRQLGIRSIILTGDNLQSARSIGEQLGITEIYADLLPTDKVRIVRELQQTADIAMVGDGINDAPALAAAKVGVAMGRVGSDAALEIADMVLMTDNLTKLVAAIRLSRKAQSVIQQNVVFALGFIGILVIGNFLGAIGLPLAVLGHEGSTVLVTLSGLRLLRSSHAV
jgi:Zn2+/Cd2+-exporting ATPase